jgi:hypothetical protein
LVARNNKKKIAALAISIVQWPEGHAGIGVPF